MQTLLQSLASSNYICLKHDEGLKMLIGGEGQRLGLNVLLLHAACFSCTVMCLQPALQSIPCFVVANLAKSDFSTTTYQDDPLIEDQIL